MSKHHSPPDQELQRKRARDRKSQQAMRDRTKGTIQHLTQQVTTLSTRLEQRARDAAALQTRIASLEAENAQLRTQNAALQLSMLSRERSDSDASQGSDEMIIVKPTATAAPWGRPLPHTSFTCSADEFLENFEENEIKSRAMEEGP